MQTHANEVGRPPQDNADLSGAQTLPGAEREDLSVKIGQPGKRRSDHARSRVCTRGPHRAQDSELPGQTFDEHTVRSPASHSLQQDVASDAEQPGPSLMAAGNSVEAQFYAYLYTGLYYEALGDAQRARRQITEAADDHFSVAGYMHGVARVHRDLLSRARPRIP